MSIANTARVFLCGAALAVGGAGAALSQELNLYTTREPGLIQPLIDAFEEENGTTVNTIFLSEGLAERVAAEGASSPADLLMTVDFGNLIDLAEQGLTQPVESEALEEAVPAHLRAEDGSWFALSTRARVLYAARDLDLDAITYEALADPEWEGRICIRSGQHPYNTALFAAYIAHHGTEEAERWLTAVKGNLARQAGGGDRDVARDIAGGICDVGIANSYYVGLMESGKGGPEQEEWAEAIKVVMPTFEDGGTQVNISGAALARNAPNRDEAVAFMEYLVSEEAQRIYAEANYEYPVREGVAADPIIAGLGELSIDETPLQEIASHRQEASELAETVGFDD